jgi:hypothetical protein
LETQSAGLVKIGRFYQLTRREHTLELKKTDNLVQTIDEHGRKRKKNFPIAKMDEFVPEILGVSPAILNNVTFCH